MTTKIEVRKAAAPESAPTTIDPLTELDPLFFEFPPDWFSAAWPGLPTTFRVSRPGTPSLLPALADVEEKDASYEIRADLPGIPKDQIEVRVHGDVVEIRGENATETEAKEKNFLRKERTYRGFQRSFRLPEPVLGDQVAARYENGTLTVSVPKAHPVEDRKVPVH